MSVSCLADYYCPDHVNEIEIDVIVLTDVDLGNGFDHVEMIVMISFHVIVIGNDDVEMMVVVIRPF